MLLLIILLLLPLAFTQQSLYITSSCAFHYHKVGANWVFDRCADPKNTAINFSRDWKVCWILCCGDWSNDRSWSSPALFNECESTKTTVANDRTAMIVGIVVGGTFLFLVLGYVIYKLTSGNERSRVDPQYKLAIIRKNIVRSLVWKSDWGRINESLQTHQDFTWRSEECAICLDQGSNTYLNCQHSYHYRCFLEWMKKSKDCPLCRLPCINEVKVRCHKCNQKHVQIQFQKLMFALDELLNEGSICHECKQQEQAQKLFDDSLGTITHNNFIR